MNKYIQIEKQMFIDLYDYFCGDKWRGDEVLAEDIRKQLESKLDKLIARELFTKYKRSPSGEEREKARQKYLDHMGITGRSDIECKMTEPPDNWE